MSEDKQTMLVALDNLATYMDEVEARMLLADEWRNGGKVGPRPKSIGSMEKPAGVGTLNGFGGCPSAETVRKARQWLDARDDVASLKHYLAPDHEGNVPAARFASWAVTAYNLS